MKIVIDALEKWSVSTPIFKELMCSQTKQWSVADTCRMELSTIHMPDNIHISEEGSRPEALTIHDLQRCCLTLHVTRHFVFFLINQHLQFIVSIYRSFLPLT